MKAEELRKYDKETLVQYLSGLIVSPYLETELDHIQFRISFDKLMATSKKLIQEMRNCKADEHQKFNELFKKNERIQKQLDKILEI